uniref:beta-1,4-xylosyltransferase IRX14-like n=1 Tax=Erigeron canadensis TaxID=72917 RepID=UPI001CB8E42E|nr:beta-1,4-xylosyltransferase IRX14-like [Erigeron canadensis]
MKFQLLQHTRIRSKTLSADSSSADPSTKQSPTTILWTIFHCLCCLISLILGFRFSRLLVFLLFTTSSTYTTPFAVDIAQTLTFTTSIKNNISSQTTATSSRVVVGRHGIRIRPWPHPNPDEVMKAHKIIQSVQNEQRVQYGVKNARSLIVVTPTYVRTFQAFHLTGLMHTLMNLQYNVVWIVVEAGGVTNETAALLAKMEKGRVLHIGFEKKMPDFWGARHKMESVMRLEALRVVREEKLDGIVMFADDSNMHSLELFDEIQKVEWIGAVSVGILVQSSHSEEDTFDSPKNLDKIDKNSTIVPVQGPACNSSDKLVGWHTFNSLLYRQKRANYIGDMAVVLPRKLEWCGFVMNARLVWEESEFRPEWIRDLEMVVAGGEEDEIENPLSFLEDASMVEPLGGCGKKVMMWWSRAEARADSKFPAGWTIDPPLEVTVPAKQTPWPDVPLELASKISTKTRLLGSRHSLRENRKEEAKNTDERVVIRSSGERNEK